jgi:hypothetical protein
VIQAASASIQQIQDCGNNAQCIATSQNQNINSPIIISGTNDTAVSGNGNQIGGSNNIQGSDNNVDTATETTAIAPTPTTTPTPTGNSTLQARYVPVFHLF